MKVTASHRSVRTLLIWLVLACLLPGVLGATILFVYQYRVGRAQQEEDTIQMARALVQAVDSHMIKAQGIAQGLSTAGYLSKEDFGRFHQRARDAVVLAGTGGNVVLRDAAGRQILNTEVEFGEALPGEAAPEQVSSVFATGKPAITDVYMGLLAQRPMMSVVVPVMQNGKVAYALGVGIFPDHFNAILQAQSLPSAWVATVFDSTGTIVGRSEFADTHVGTPIDDGLLRAMTQSREGSREGIARDGVPVVCFYSRSSNTGWGVAIDIPSQTLEDALVLPLSVLAGGMLALFAIGLLLAWVMGGRIAYSVKALTAPAFALGTAESVSVPTVYIEEAAEVGRAISRASAMLAERAAALRAREFELTEAHRLARFGTWYWNLTTGAVETSDSIREIYGRDVPDSYNEVRGTVLTVESWERASAAAQEAVRTGKGYDLELQVNHGAGHTIWINAKCEVVRNEEVEVVALRGTVQDITARKRYEQALRDSERQAVEAASQAEAERRRLDAVLEAAPIGITVADVAGAVLVFNAAHKRIWCEDYPIARNIGAYHRWKAWWADGSERHGKRVESHEWAMVRALKGESVSGDTIEIETFADPPMRRMVMLSAAPIRDAEGNITGAVAAQQDITERIRAENALKQADRRKDEFLAMLAHELRNPLAPIAAAADLLGLGSQSEARIRKTSTIISRQVRHMTALVDDLLDVSRVTRGRVVLDKRKLDVQHIVSDALEQVRPLMQARGQRLIVHTPAEPALVMGDPKRLVQVLTNLLNNAAKFTPPDGEIELQMKLDHDFVTLIVKDSGIGMAPAVVDRAFELFAQGERTPDRSQGGLGIGLALVKGLVDLHNGSVTAHSAGIGKGSRFTVRLWREKEKRAIVGAAQVPALRTNVDPLSIMVVDDNVDAAQALAMFLEAQGHQVLVENSSIAALDRAIAVVPDLCLLDIGLPEMDGNELARRLRAHPETAAVLLVAVTGYGQDRDRKRSMDAGFDHYFVKPLNATKLADLLREVRPQNA